MLNFFDTIYEEYFFTHSFTDRIMKKAYNQACAEKSKTIIIHFFKVCLEGEISKDIIMNSLSRGKRASGDMIPWTVSQQFNDHEFGNLSGARVVRIATHPDFQKVNFLFLLSRVLSIHIVHPTPYTHCLCGVILDF